MRFESLIKGEYIKAAVDEQIIFNQLDMDTNAVWSLLFAYFTAVNRGRWKHVKKGLQKKEHMEAWFSRWSVACAHILRDAFLQYSGIPEVG